MAKKSTLPSFQLFNFSIYLYTEHPVYSLGRDLYTRNLRWNMTPRNNGCADWTVYVFVRYRDEEFRQFIRDLVGQITRWFSDLTNMKYTGWPGPMQRLRPLKRHDLHGDRWFRRYVTVIDHRGRKRARSVIKRRWWVNVWRLTENWAVSPW